MKTEGYRLPAARIAAAAIGLSVLLAAVSLISLAFGSAGDAVPLSDVTRAVSESLTGKTPAPDDLAYEIVIGLRLPRVIVGALVGLCLSAAGTALQGLLRNPLADPYVTGISAGGSLGAVAMVVLGLDGLVGGAALPAGAFVAAMATLALVYALGRRQGRLSLEGFLLAGVAVGAFAWAAMTALLALKGTNAEEILFWLLGNLGQRERYVLPLALVTLIAWPLLFVHGRALNLLTLGEESAAQLGVPVERARTLLIVGTALATAGAVSVSGIIAFVGLIVPHAARRLFGPDHRVLLIAAPLAGASFLVLADTLARVAPGGQNLPVGVVTALVGGPFFLYLLRQRQGQR
jgi:iron complex transport system permease protein